ncbi:MAG: glutathione S-transferase N-terminal domain-containing protein, partial [Pseudomonadota bacterium]
MKPRLISFPVCPYVQRARILLNSKQVEHDIDYIDLFAKPDWYLDRVPTGKV